ncbi:MAG: pantoate--beta-alanine ligase [Bacteroidetes bacterium]|nr:pantoate--beta-alanine ligase [Bacteroidota bacterium]
MLQLKTVKELKKAIKFLQNSNSKSGFVPTMGALHLGHISLIERCKQENDTTICSIFINPLQFNDKNDLIKYPKTIEKDIEMLVNSGVDILFLPDANEVYPENFIPEKFDFNGLDSVFEGKLRPGHFNGVANVLKKLFEFVEPNNVYLGQKDFQQTLIVKKMVESLNLPIKINVCEIKREQNGLAMSSRNSRLSEENRTKAGFLFSILNQLKENVLTSDFSIALQQAKNMINSTENAELEYLEIVNRRNLTAFNNEFIKNESVILAAVNYCNVRLLDNALV